MSRRPARVRARLTLLAAAVSVAASLLAGQAIYAVAVRTASSEGRLMVREETETALALLQSHPELPPGEALAPLLREAEGRGERHLRVVIDGAEVLAVPPGFHPALAAGGDGLVAEDVERLPGSPRLQVGAAAFSAPGGKPGLIQLARPSRPSERTRQTWRIWLISAGLMLLAVSAGMAWLVTGRILTPIASMVETAASLKPGRDEIRLPESGRQDEFGALARALNRLLVRLDESARQADRFAADAAHELSTPLAGLRLMIEVEGMRPRDAEEQARFRADALSTIGRLEERLQALLALARVSGGPAPQSVPLELQDWTDDALAPWRARASESGISLVTDARGITRAPEDWLRLVLDNLLGNALRHSREGGSVEVSAVAEDGWTTLRVADRGPGLAPGTEQRIWEPFFHGEREPGVAGLGLSLCDAVCRRLGGERSARNRMGGGAEFMVRLHDPEGAAEDKREFIRESPPA